jgi:transcriptional regulator with XRE-family HTH domain
MPSRLSALVRQRLRRHLDQLVARPTQKQLGDAIDRTQTWVSHYLSGRHDVDLDTLGHIAAFLDIDLGSLVTPDGDVRQQLPEPYAEAVTLLQAVTHEERDAVLDILRSLARKPSTRRAR